MFYECQKPEGVGYVKHHKLKKPKHLASSTYRKKKKSCKKSNKQEASQKTHSTLVPPSHLYLLAFYLGATSSSAASRTDQHCLPQQGSLSNRGLPAFHGSPVISKALIRSTPFSCTATFLLPHDKCPNLQSSSCHTVRSACTAQALT